MTIIERSIEINATPERIWSVLAHDFAKVGDWTSVVLTSAPNTDVGAPDDATVGGRVCTAPGFGDVKETFTTYDEAGRKFSYKADGLPGFVKNVTNSWSVTAQGENTSMVAMKMNLTTGGIGKVMTPILKNQMGKAGSTMLDELKVYIERGEISAKKKKQLAKLAKK